MNKIIKNTLILTAITAYKTKGVSDSASRGFRVYIQQFR